MKEPFEHRETRTDMSSSDIIANQNLKRILIASKFKYLLGDVVQDPKDKRRMKRSGEGEQIFIKKTIIPIPRLG